MRITVTRRAPTATSLLSHFTTTGNTIDYRPDLTAKTGGGATALDGIDFTDIPAGRIIRILFGGTTPLDYLVRVDTTTAPDGDYVIQPVGYHATNNPKKLFKVS